LDLGWAALGVSGSAQAVAMNGAVIRYLGWRDAVADAGCGADDGGSAELAAQPSDGNGDGIGERVGVFVPDLFE
jgi:hypothetical protein